MAEVELQRAEQQLRRGGRACDRVGIRDTKNREAGHLAVPVPRFLDFIGSVKDEAFER
jgi:hypothetical protein